MMTICGKLLKKLMVSGRRLTLCNGADGVYCYGCEEAYLRQEDGKLSFQTLKSLPLLNNAVKETVRLRSAPIILRRVQQNVAIGSYTVPKGNFLCLSPLWAHREPNICPEGDVWNPYRWQVNSIENTVFRDR